MIIIIGGFSCTGKTLMAQNLLEKYSMSYLSLDHLKMGMYRSGSNCGFTPLDHDELIGNKLWPIVKGMMMTAIENKQNLIIEGSYILPHHISELENEYFSKIIAVFLVFSTNYLKEHFKDKIVKYRGVIEARDEEEERTIKEFIHEHEQLKVKCEEFDVQYFQISKDYEQEMIKVYDYIETAKQEIEKKSS